MPRTLRSLILAAICACCALIPAAASAATAPHRSTATAPHGSAATAPHGSAATAPHGSAATAPATQAPATLNLVLPLSAHLTALARYSNAVNTPGDTLYHRYRSIAWLADHFGASAASERRVVAYLTAHGATHVKIDATGLFIDATLRTATAEQLFGTALQVHADRAGAYTTPEHAVTVPPALKGAVTGVVGLDTQSVVSAPDLARAPQTDQGTNPFASISGTSITHTGATGTAAAAPACGAGTSTTSGYLKCEPFATSDGTQSGCTAGQAVGGFTPNQYLDAYGYNAVQASGIAGQGERVALIEVDGFKRSDVDTFDKCFGLPTPKIKAFRTSASVSNKGLPAGGEATLDLEVLSAAAPDLSQIDVYESTQDISSVLESLTAPLENPGYKPEVISASLGLCEADVRLAVGLNGIKSTEAALELASDSGISVLAASGDDGSSDCVNSNSEEALPVPELAVNFPASSPYVTSVGGTNLTLTAANTIASQVVWNDGAEAPGSAGGGGFSSVFARPSYQAGVNTTTHRSVPDVSGLADVAPGYDIYCTANPDCVSEEPGEGPSSPWQPVGGTSASTPLLAGGLALIDQELRNEKRQSLGLVNPLLYSLGENATENPQVFNDVTVGSNDVGPYIRASHAPVGGYSAAPGYDEASGWGSVNLPALATYALSTQPALPSVSETVPANTTAIRRGVIYDTVSCTGKCDIGALARITVGNGKPVTEYSGLYTLPAAGAKTIKIPIKAAELKKLRLAVADHDRVTASIVGAITDAVGNIESRTPAQQITLAR